MIYDENYYRSANYTNYLSRKDRYIQLAAEISDLLRKTGMIDKSSVIVDYGCAVGFTIQGFKEAGYQHVTGYDISEWAITEARKAGHTIHDKVEDISCDILLALDVLEHMTDPEIQDLFSKIQLPSIVVTRIPCSTDGGKSFHLPISRQDPTHINCKDKHEWISLFQKIGYHSYFKLNLFSIYDSDGVACIVFFR